MRQNTVLRIRTLYLALIIAFFNSPIKAQMTVSTQEPMTPAFLKQVIETLIGNGVYVVPGSVSISGGDRQVAIYNISGNSGNLPFSRGVILSTCFASSIAKPDTVSRPLSDKVPPLGFLDTGDTLLSQFTSKGTKDAITLQFTFRPQSSPLVFRYGIGTEEYPDFVNTPDFNDVFGFFISGQNPSGGTYSNENIAILPNSQVAGVFNIFSNSTYLIDTKDNRVHAFNGVSTAFSCSLNVVPCTDYVIKLKICDVSDESFDSAVFLQANSFGSIPVSLNPVLANADSSMTEGCTPSRIVATKNEPALLNQEITIPLIIEGTASNGTDYTGLPASIVIPAGQTSVSIDINAVADNIPESTESIIISYATSCGLFDTLVFYIKDKGELKVTTSDPPTICPGSGPVTITAEASDGIGPYSYSWSNGANTQSTDVNPASTTTYTVTATDACGASGTGTVNVTVQSHTAAPRVQSNSPVCQGQDLNLNCPDAADSYTWSGPGNWIKTGASVSRVAMTPNQSGTYTLETIKNGCPGTPVNFVVVVFDASFVPPASGNSPICTGNKIQLQAGTPGASNYVWTGPSGFSSNIENPEIPNADVSMQGDYQVYFISGACTSATATVPIQVKPSPIADAGPDVELCSMQTIGIGSMPAASVNYSWQPLTGLDNANLSNPQLSVSNTLPNPQTVSYVLTADLNGCRDYDTVQVVVKPVPVAGFPRPTSQCFRGHSFDFNAQGNYPIQAIYHWDFGASATPSTANTASVQNVRFSSTGEMPVSLSIDLDGCSSNIFVNTVKVLEMPVANFTSNLFSGCEPLAVQFQNLSEDQSQGLKYLWDFGNGFASGALNPRIVFSKSGRFDVSIQVTNEAGCVDKYTIPAMIQVYPSPIARFSVSPFKTSITQPEVFIEDLSRFADTSWYSITRAKVLMDSIQGFDIEYSFKDSGSYKVTQYLSNRFGCTSSFERDVRVDLGFKVYIPSAFTPNNDDNNDYFRAYGEDISDFYIRVYNRWGQLIYQSWDITNGWDGTSMVDGAVVPGGAYLYLIRLRDKYGKDYSFDGTVQVLR